MSWFGCDARPQGHVAIGESDTKFFLKRTPWQLTFTRDDSGEVVSLTLNGQTPGSSARTQIRRSGDADFDETRSRQDEPDRAVNAMIPTYGSYPTKQP